MEMHQVYRLDSSTDVDLASIDLRISLGELAGGRTFRQVAGQQLSLLRFFGLDEDAPADRVDAAQVFQPARDAFAMTGSPIGGTFIVFPTLRPFAEPAPLASARLDAGELRDALGRDANDVIYDDPDPVTRAGAARFRLNFAYRVRVDGMVTSFSLGAFGIREGSENLYLGGRTLVRDVDYTIDYEIGTVMLLTRSRCSRPRRTRRSARRGSRSRCSRSRRRRCSARARAMPSARAASSTSSACTSPRSRS
jgi:cell surface protein SprA